MNAVDTNILIYLHDDREPAKKAAANKLIDTLDDGLLLWQVACEYVAASRKLVPQGYTLDDAKKRHQRPSASVDDYFAKMGCLREIGGPHGPL